MKPCHGSILYSPLFLWSLLYFITHHAETATVKVIVIDDDSDLEEEEHNEGIASVEEKCGILRRTQLCKGIKEKVVSRE